MFEAKQILLSVSAVVVVGATILWWRKRRSRSYEKAGIVSGLYFYPVKSCKGIPLGEAECFSTGIKHDRCWVLEDGDRQFVSARRYPTMVLVTPHFEDDYLCLDAPGMETIKVTLHLDTKDFKQIRMWDSYAEGQFAGEDVSTWFSQYLNEPDCKFYQVSKPRFITDDTKWGDISQPGDKLAFADFAPYLITTETSLSALNEELRHPVTMGRFRPNIVISGTERPWVEDDWKGKSVMIGSLKIRVLKPCGRCVLTTVDLVTGEKDPEKQPLVTLQRIRLPEDRDKRYGYSPLFGLHCVVENEGVVRMRDPVMVSS